MESIPLVSVIMPVYNGSRHLRAAIDSVLKQTFEDFELIVLNDGSTDSTERIILSYDDDRIVYIRNETNLKLIKTLNKGVAISRGRYIARMDADDVALPWRFQRQIDVLESGGCDVVSSSDIKIDENGAFLGYGTCLAAQNPEMRFLMIMTNPVNHPTVMIASSVIKRFLYVDTPDTAHVEDYDLWARLAHEHMRFTLLPEPLLLYRRTGSNITEIHLPSLLASSRKIAERIQESVLGNRASEVFLDFFVLRTARKGFGDVRMAAGELNFLFRRYCSEHPEVDVSRLADWIDFMKVQAVLRLGRSLPFRTICLLAFFRSTIRYAWLRFMWRVRYSRYGEALVG